MLEFSTVCSPIRTESAVKSVIGTLKTKNDNEQKLWLLMSENNNRVVFNPTDLCYYGWIGHAYDPYDSKQGTKELLLVLSAGTKFFFLKKSSFSLKCINFTSKMHQNKSFQDIRSAHCGKSETNEE